MKAKKRLLLGAGALGTVGAVATLVAGTTFGFFSATTPIQTSKFTAGTVTLNNSATYTCTISNPTVSSSAVSGTSPSQTVANITPGDSGTCTFAVAYGGSVPADIALDVTVAGTAGSPVQAYAPGNTGTTPTAAPGLYDGSANGLQLSITDSGSVTYNSGHSWTEPTLNTGGTAPATAQAADILVAGDTTSSTFGGSGTDTFTVAYSLPAALANNAYQGAKTTITFLVHAVQWANNNTSGVASCTAGTVCSAPAWS